MALTFIVSPSLGELAQQLHRQFEQNPVPVFQARTLVTQTQGMNQWLKIQLAGLSPERIAANLQFLTPADVLHKVYAALGGSFPDKLAPEHLCWILFSILGAPDFKKRYPKLSDYYADGQHAVQKQMALAEKMTDLLDQYQVYRTDMIQDWNQGILTHTDPNHHWQADLWQRAKAIAGDQLLDRTQQGRDIETFLQDPLRVAQLQARMPAIHLFGLSILTQYHIRILSLLSEHINIHLYFLNPAPDQYWYSDIGEKTAERLIQKGLAKREDLLVGNTLLMQWGSVVKNTFALLFKQDIFLNAYESVSTEPTEPTTLLHLIQSEIEQNIPTEARSLIPESFLYDESLSIHAHYTPVREVEALYNYLVYLIDEQKSNIGARDILVMVPNINAYAPFIKAVFDHGPYRFPYSIADEQWVESDNMASALVDVLSLTEENFTAEEVLQILDHRCIRNKFGIHRIDSIRRWVDEANIRFGLNGDPALQTQYVSWRHGIRRMMLGICMIDDTPIPYGDDYIDPLPHLEGADAREAIAFCQAIETLMALIEGRTKSRNIQGWIEYVRLVIEKMIEVEEDSSDEVYQSIEAQLDQYTPVFETVSDRYPYSVFTQHFMEGLRLSTRSQTFAGVGITFCSPVPMRSIPFQVVAFLGLNYDQFPRQETKLSFDLMQLNPMPGDRQLKLNDKHLFLETILSARQHLYLSYIGRDSRDNALLPPSAMIDELIDYIEIKLEQPVKLRSEWVLQHPLHPYSRQYNQPGSRYISYLINGDRAALPSIWLPQEKSEENPDSLSLRILELFYSQPVRCYFEQRLKIHYATDTHLLPETEKFKLNKLEEWNWRNTLLDHPESNWPELVEKGIRTGDLPLCNLGRKTSADIEGEAIPLKALIKPYQKGSAEARSFEMKIDGLSFTGTLEPLYENTLIQICTSSHETKYQIQFYIRYLAGIASGLIQQSVFISKKQGKSYLYAPLSREQAQEKLSDLISHWQANRDKRPTLLPEEDQWEKLIKDQSDWVKFIDKKFENDHYTTADAYETQLYQEGWFDQPAAYEAFLYNHALLLESVQTALIKS